jgi:hypothetical protein
MTDGEQEFFVKLTALADLIPGFTLSPTVVEIYSSNLAPLGYEKVCMALDRIIVERSSRDPFPSVKEIRLRVAPETAVEDDANFIVNRVIRSIARIGPYETAKARVAIGEIGWAIVQDQGGWEQTCAMLTNDNMGTLKAQWRDLAKAYITRERSDHPHREPQLRHADRRPGELLSMHDVLRRAESARISHAASEQEKKDVSNGTK